MPQQPPSTIYKTAAKQIIDQDPGTTQPEGNSTHLNNNNRCENKTIDVKNAYCSRCENKQ